MKSKWLKKIEDAWYTEMYISSWLMPISMFYVDAVRLRRFCYRIGILKKYRLPVPVIIVGNLTVGGTGKTPFVIWLVELLIQQGYKPGVISRGYKGNANANPQLVTANSDVSLVGDEAFLISKRCACPVAISVKRVDAAKLLLSQYDCNIIISDDGLQHYALQRDIEILIVDGQRRFGNGYCLPVGPLREPPERKEEVDLIVVNTPTELEENEFAMYYEGGELINMVNDQPKLLSEFKNLNCHAVAGLGNPSRFFIQLEKAGLHVNKHAYPDHHPFIQTDLSFKDDLPVIMTEKDAVKCKAFAKINFWYLPINANLPLAFSEKLLTLLKDKSHG